ncbi:MAG: C4-dicarboxylate ABC transporter substrate-binding protein, partial [Acetomicrobium sp.]
MVSLALICVFFTSVGFADTPSQLRFMAGPPGGNWFALGGALADLWT